MASSARNPVHTPKCVMRGFVRYTPIIIDVLGNGFNLTDAAGGVDFALDDNGIRSPVVDCRELRRRVVSLRPQRQRRD